MRRISLLVIFLTLFVATAGLAAQEQETMYVSITYVHVKPGMTAAFNAAAADHLAWRKSINDTHYYNVSQVVSGPRSGQMMFASIPSTGAQLDAADAANAKLMQDWAGRGAFQFIEGFDSVVVMLQPDISNPPAPGETYPMVHAYELDVDMTKVAAFDEAVKALNEANSAVDDADPHAWVIPISGAGFNKRWFVTWVDGWAGSGPNAAREAQAMEAAGGAEAYGAIMTKLVDSITGSMIVTYMSIPGLSHTAPQ